MKRINKKTFFEVAFLCIAFFIIAFVAFDLCESKSITAFSTDVWKIEPEKAQDIDDPPFGELPEPSVVLPIRDVMTKGKGLELQFAYNDPDWKRQAYKSYWYNGRWSYVPNRIHYAMHRLFVTYPTASVYYDFIHDLGIATESNSFKIPSSETSYTNIVVVVMQARVQKILTLGNQVVIVAEPALTGLQVILVPVSELEPHSTDESILFQLVTANGSEYDKTTLNYVTSSSD